MKSKTLYFLRVTEMSNGKLQYDTESDFKGDSIKGLLVLYKLNSDAKEISKWILDEVGDFKKANTDKIVESNN